MYYMVCFVINTSMLCFKYTCIHITCTYFNFNRMFGFRFCLCNGFMLVLYFYRYNNKMCVYLHSLLLLLLLQTQSEMKSHESWWIDFRFGRYLHPLKCISLTELLQAITSAVKCSIYWLNGFFFSGSVLQGKCHGSSAGFTFAPDIWV